MDAMISFLFLLVALSIYYWGVRTAMALKKKDMVLLCLVLMAFSLRAALSFGGIPPLRIW